MIVKKIQIYINTGVTIDLLPFLAVMFQYYKQRGITLNYDITPIAVTGYQSVQKNATIGNAIVDVLRGAESLVPVTDHDIVMFIFNLNEWKAPWWYPYPLRWDTPRNDCHMVNGKPFINIGIYPPDPAGNQMAFLHEPMHVFAEIFGCQDQMDTYYKNNLAQYQDSDSNFSIQWKLFAPYLTSPMNTQSKLALWCQAATKIENADPALNNPGNIRYVMGTWMQKLAVGQKNGFCIFPTLAVGQHVLEQFFINAATGKSQIYHPTDTLVQFYSKYAPSSDHNNPNAYASFVAGIIGVPASTQIQTLV